MEISPTARPPVCRILDFGKWKYEQSKKDKANKAKTKTAELKEVRLGRSMKIDPHDVGIRVLQARRFLLEGHKVQIVQNFRGREIAHRSKGDERMRDIVERLSDLGKVEMPPRMAGRRMSMVFAPDKAKVEAFKKREIAAGRAVLPQIPEHIDEPDDDLDDELELTGEIESTDVEVESADAEVESQQH